MITLKLLSKSFYLIYLEVSSCPVIFLQEVSKVSFIQMTKVNNARPQLLLYQPNTFISRKLMILIFVIETMGRNA